MHSIGWELFLLKHLRMLANIFSSQMTEYWTFGRQKNVQTEGNNMNAKILATMACSVGLMVGPVLAEDKDWTKSRFGPDDMAGASNLMTPAKALEATKLMKTGTVLSIGRVYQPEMPLFGARVFAVRGTGGLAGGPLGENNVIWMDDFLATEIGQVGTQFDGLSHIGVGGAEGTPVLQWHSSRRSCRQLRCQETGHGACQTVLYPGHRSGYCRGARRSDGCR